MESLQSKLDNLQRGVHALTQDLKSRDINEFTELVNQIMRDMKDIACEFKGPNPEEVNDRETVCEYNKLLQLVDFDVKLAHSNMDRDTAFKYPWITTKNCEERLKILELSIQVFADTVVDAGSSKIACTPPFTKLAVMFEAIVIEYLKLRHRRTATQLDGAVKDRGEFITNWLRQYHTKSIPRDAIYLKVAWDGNKGAWAVKQGHWVDPRVPELENGAIQVIMIEPKELLNSPYKAKEQYDEENTRHPHPLLQRCKLDFLDREDGVLHWSLGGVVAWRFYGEDSWMDRFGHVINEYE
ncbi:hypothetical protein FOXG_14696 [Fusarium oxysporum f. sp. lycopersici 4287]|uniref:Uncharacterized protein n=3 Tax=Fusarium oxysporum TaxID=5507 RepID=A0A0J9VZQ2_FUSO4|nr:hypothetical protein FOXG_14696 [Fusarium oxysporum f. sp. lycopersici 4287]EXK35794.1 hypothetical protein FOMG_08999 [Fusarium oxysporum f. sp. melonis 26406]KNB16263.1 hypothetical protein FOXG_14696 [Fusarium oxysporum f. sp. lycopersici 4287]